MVQVLDIRLGNLEGGGQRREVADRVHLCKRIQTNLSGMISKSVDCGDCKPNAIQMQAITRALCCLSVLISQQQHALSLLSIILVASARHTPTPQKIYIAAVSVLDSELWYRAWSYRKARRTERDNYKKSEKSQPGK